MANWALVENNEIKEVHDLLPKNWRNVSGLRLSENDLEFLKSLGWLPVTKNHQQYDKTTHREIGVTHVLENDDVIETLILTEKEPIIQQPSFEQLKYNFMVELRTYRDKKLLESDWTQLNDVVTKMNDSEKLSWITYRQMLRDLPEKYFDNEIIYIEQVIWPEFQIIEIDTLINEE